MSPRHIDPSPALERGLALFPLPVGAKGPAPAGWQHTATRDPAVLATRWSSPQNLGVACRANGLFILDVDWPHGHESLAKLYKRTGQSAPATFRVETPHGGMHIYFRAPFGIVLPSASGGTSGLGPGIDTRGPGRRLGGYVLAPGSIVDGRAYTIGVDAEIAALPAWLLDQLQNAHTPAARPGLARRTRSEAR